MKRIIALVVAFCIIISLLYGCNVIQTDMTPIPSETQETTIFPFISVSSVESEAPISQEPKQSTAPNVNEINRYDDPMGNPTLLNSYEIYKDGRYLYLPSGDNSEVLLEIPFSFESRIGFEFASGPTGPQSFFIDGNEIYIGNTYKHNILKYIDGKYDSEFEYDSSLYLLDFCIIDGTYYILTRTYDFESGNPKITLNVMAGSEELIKQIDIINLTDSFESYIHPSKVYVYGDDLIIKFEHTGDFFILDLTEEDNWVKYSENYITINTTNEDTFSLKSNAGTIVLPVYGDLKNPSNYWINENIYYITNDYKYKDESAGSVVAEEVLTIVNGNEVKARVLLFNKSPMITLNRRLFVSQDSQVYQMLFDDEYNLSILKLDTEEQYVSYWFK